MMLSPIIFVITAVNGDFSPGFPVRRGRAFIIACGVGVPIIFFVAFIARKLKAPLPGMPA